MIFLSEDILFLDACDTIFRKVVSEEEGWEVPQEQGQPLLFTSEPFLRDLGGS